MEKLYQKIDDLEKRVLRLEHELRIEKNLNSNLDTHSNLNKIEKRLQRMKEKDKSIGVETAAERHREKEPIKNIIMPKEEVVESENIYTENPKYQLKEALVGKYVVGALASLLVFIGAISLVVLLWDQITPAFKLTMLVLVSVAMTTTGYIRIMKKRDHINSIILGTGAGLLFITILSSHMYFGYISSNVAFLLAGLWSILFILAYKYTQTYFTTIIAYIGSYIATILGLSLVNGNIELNVIIAFVTSISLALLTSGYKWLGKKQQLINSVLSLVSYVTVIVWITGNISFEKGTNTDIIYLALLSLIIYVIKNIANVIVDSSDEEHNKWLFIPLVLYIVIGFIVGTCLTIGLEEVGRNIFIAISIAQIIYGEFKFKKIAIASTTVNITYIAVAWTVAGETVLSSLSGLVVLIGLLMIIEAIKKINIYEEVRIGLIIFSMYQVLVGLNIDKVNLILYLLTLLVLILMVGKILHDKYKEQCGKNLILIKVVGYLLLIESVVVIISEYIVRVSRVRIFNDRPEGYITYVAITAIIILALKLSYFKNWLSADFKWNTINENVDEDRTYILFYISTFLMYIVGLFMIIGGIEGYNILVMILSTIAIMVVQSVELLKIREKSEYIEVWEGLKYLIYIWVIMVSVFNAEMSSVATSIAGLIVALASISLGFNKKMKGLRLYGLVVTLIMVFKVITIDMGGQNSITRVVSLIAGGLICFVISIVYNKIDKNIDH